MKHKVSISVSNRKGNKQTILNGGKFRLPKRLLKFFFGDFCEMLVLTPGQSVESVEIHEVKKGEDDGKPKATT